MAYEILITKQYGLDKHKTLEMIDILQQDDSLIAVDDLDNVNLYLYKYDDKNGLYLYGNCLKNFRNVLIYNIIHKVLLRQETLTKEFFIAEMRVS